MQKKTKFTKVDEDILNELYPPRLNDDEEWDWSDYDGFANEIIPWSFSSSEILSEEEFLVLYHAWNAIHPRHNSSILRIYRASVRYYLEGWN